VTIRCRKLSLCDNEPGGGKRCQGHALMLIRQFHRYSPSTHFMELTVIMRHRIGRPNAGIQLFCSFIDCHSSVLKNQFPSSFFILCSWGCCWMTRVLCISHTCTAICKHFSPLIHNSTSKRIVPILSTRVLIYLSTWYTFSPQRIPPCPKSI
jgi:hypothetical protein